MVTAPPSDQRMMNSQICCAHDAPISSTVPAIRPVQSTGRGPTASRMRPDNSETAAPSRYEPMKAALTPADDQPSSSCMAPVIAPKP